MRILLVEDEAGVVADIRAVLATDDELVVAGSRDEATAVLVEDNEFDLIVCDLRIPPVAGEGLLADETHGLAVHAACRERVPGCPLRFFSGRGNLDNLADALSEGGPIDLFGDGVKWALVHVHQKRHAANFVEELRRLREGLAQLQTDVTIESTDNFGEMTERALRIYARRVEATKVIARRAGTGTGGLSGADALAAQFVDDSGVLHARNFIKVGEHERIQRELAAFDRYVTTLLITGFTPRATVLNYGLRDQSAVSYVLAAGFDRDLFTLLPTSEDVAVGALDRLINNLEPWRQPWHTERMTIASMRQRFVADEVIAGTGRDLDEFAAYEARELQVPIAVAHGDLHGGNVLVRTDGEPMLIDFGDVGQHWSGLDPITLELSLSFHPDSPLRGLGWPSEGAAEQYMDLDAYLADCPSPQFVRAVRSWALNCVQDEAVLRAVFYAQTTRQLKYLDTDHAVAEAFARGSRL